jgi:ubiquinone biosynthesis protein
MVSVLNAARDLARLREITSVLVRHGFGEIVARAGLGRRRRERASGKSEPPPEGEDKAPASAAGADLPEITADDDARGAKEAEQISTAVRVRLVAQDLGPTFIKLGQIASTRPDLLPADVITELKKLQDEVPAVPFAEVKAAVERSLGAPLHELFVRFDEKPLATASIGQVHKAVLATPEGELPVVVKVQRPGVGEIVARDLDLLHFLAATVERAIPETKVYSPVGLVQQFDRSITAELDFTIEAENAERFAKNFAGKPEVRFPRIHRGVSSKHVLVQEFFEGKKLDAAIAAGASGPLIAKRSVGIIIKMIFEDGFFHADPHPGNIFVLGSAEEPVIGLIDTGMVGRLSPELRDLTVDLMIAAVRKDVYAVADALYAIGRPTRKVDMREYRAEVAMLAEKYLGKPLKEIEMSALIRDLVQGAVKYGLEIPPDFMLVGKALMTVEGIGKQLDPDLDVFGEASPYFYEILKQRYSPERVGNELLRGAMQLSRAGYDMPLQLREVLDDLRLGRLAIRTVDPELPKVAERLGARVRASIVMLALIIGGAVAFHGRRDVAAYVLWALAFVAWFVHNAADSRK